MPTYHLIQRVLEGETTVAGRTDYQGGDFSDQNNRMLGSWTMLTEQFTTVTDQPNQNLNTGGVTLQLFFSGQGQGQRPGVQETIVLEGLAQFNTPSPSQPPTTPPATRVPGREVTVANGSVSAATQMFQPLIAHLFSLTPISTSPQIQLQLIIQ